jgi:acyl dehydratase
MAKVSGEFNLDEVRALLGKEKPLTLAEAYLAECPVDVSELRRYALSVDDCNPLWFDNEYAKRTKWKGIIAPPTFMHTCGGGTALFVHIEGTDDWPHGSLYAGSEFEFFLPIRVGDKITPRSHLKDVVGKKGRFVGPIVFVTAEIKFTNQKSELVGIWRSSVAKYSIAKAQKKASYMTEELGPLFPEEYPNMRKGESRARGAKPRYYEDVSIGEEITPLVRRLTIPQIVSTADVSQRISIVLPYTMPGPGCYWHYAAGESWKIRGLPAPMDEGPIRCAQPSQLMTDWMGDDGWLSRLNIKIRRPIYAGDTTTWRGKITSKYIKDQQHIVECEFWAENQRGQISTQGTSTIILPSRSK